MFVLYGPNTNHGSGSVPYTLESQFNYVIDGRPPAARRRLSLDRPAPGDPGGVAGGDGAPQRATRSGRPAAVSNWYVNSHGENTNNWPGAWLEYRRRTRRLNPGDYRVAV